VKLLSVLQKEDIVSILQIEKPGLKDS
jgi:hypothetical protein